MQSSIFRKSTRSFGYLFGFLSFGNGAAVKKPDRTKLRVYIVIGEGFLSSRGRARQLFRKVRAGYPGRLVNPKS